MSKIELSKTIEYHCSITGDKKVSEVRTWCDDEVSVYISNQEMHLNLDEALEVYTQLKECLEFRCVLNPCASDEIVKSWNR